ncbi:MAG: glycoside hydrolase domain-containing protein [Candidatus Acidiferrum sp.]
MKPSLSLLFVSAIAATLIFSSYQAGARSGPSEQEPERAYLGFDLNIFPGAAALPKLRKTFAFGGYWLSPPPGEKSNPWIGKRELMRSQDFGFLLLYRGRQSRELKSEMVAMQRGTLDARNAAVAAKKDGFPARAIIFLDVEEGGRLPATYHAYLRAWAKDIAEAGYRPGVYCSGMAVREEPGVTITTADDIRSHAPAADFTFYVFNDACPPSPGCTFLQNPPPPIGSGISYAELWQYAQSPRSKERTAHCAPGYHSDGNCYAPGDTNHTWFLDLDSSNSPDPSKGR